MAELGQTHGCNSTGRALPHARFLGNPWTWGKLKPLRVGQGGTQLFLRGGNLPHTQRWPHLDILRVMVWLVHLLSQIK